MANTKFLITIIFYILIYNQCCYGQQISYLAPSKGNKIYKYNFIIDNGIELKDSILLAEFTFNSKGFCVENYQFESHTKSSYIYKDDTILISSNFSGGLTDNNPLNSETYNFYNEKNQLLKTEIKHSGHLQTLIEYKYNKKQRNIEDIIKSSDNKTIGRKKRYYKDSLLVMEKYLHKDGNYKSFNHFSYNTKGQITAFYHGRTKNEKTLSAQYHYEPNGIIIKKAVNLCEDILSETIYDSKMNILFEKEYQNGLLNSVIKYHYSKVDL